MTDLERLFQQLVAALAAADSARLNRAIRLGDIRDSILPYRTSRRALGVDSVEDYDLLLLRLAAGEGGFARTTPEDARVRFAKEAAGSNPDLGLLDQHAGASLTLEGLRVARALAANPDERYAPPRPGPDLALDPELDSPEEVLELDVTRPISGDASLSLPLPPSPSSPSLFCLYCGATLPTGRTVNFCPGCGQSQTTPHCPQCQSEVELGWRHCITCGAALQPI